MVVLLHVLLCSRYAKVGEYPLDADLLRLVEIQKCSIHIKKKHLVFFHDLFSPVLYFSQFSALPPPALLKTAALPGSSSNRTL